MTILFRNSEWFLHEHQSKLFIQAKEPLASKIRSLIHHAKPELIKVFSIYSKTTLQTTFLSKTQIQSGWKTAWEHNSQMTQEWLLYIYLNLCIQSIICPNIEQVWFTQKGECIHSDWDQVGVRYTQKEFIELLVKQVTELSKMKSFCCEYESAPWSFHSFIQLMTNGTVETLKQITEHPWWVRQELSNSHSRNPSFSLDPPALKLDETDIETETETEDEHRGEMMSQLSQASHITNRNAPRSRAHTDRVQATSVASCNSFPIRKGSMLSTPPLKSFENHLSSKRTKTQPSVIHRLIRISSSFLK